MPVWTADNLVMVRQTLKSDCLFLGFWVLFISISFQWAFAADSPLVVADGGYTIVEPGNPNAYSRLALSVRVENAQGVSSICGQVKHPYGAGLFDVAVSPDSVVDASVTTFPDEIHFTIRLDPDISSEPTELFLAKPRMEIARPGNHVRLVGYESYPNEIRWLSVEVWDAAGARLDVATKTSPVLRYDDVYRSLTVRTDGFDDRVVRMYLVAMNGVILYPPLRLAGGTRDVFKLIPSPLDGLTSLPLTFSLETLNGGRYVIDIPRASHETILRPPSAISRWWTGYR